MECKEFKPKTIIKDFAGYIVLSNHDASLHIEMGNKHKCIGSNNSSIDTLDSFITKPLATQLFIKSEQAIFEKLMIQATVSAGFPLRWVKNKKVQELFHFLNPALILPGCKTLGGRILNDESKILENEMTKKLMNDSVDVTLTLMLQTLQKESYGKYVQIAIGNDTRWNSYYECFYTLIKSKGALRVQNLNLLSNQHLIKVLIIYYIYLIIFLLFYLTKPGGNYFPNL
ncbi:hypothetical protein RhiirC2_718978 [Rhizophagus irregularis]|uniref:Uncharacterized protein n=1 Tax=Rhizophagus irregularis TaxID=588596 RepID=A0A2N1MG61_9GLOM|nr:hypothetical protein RhiirC2_718978 [Rhizophagus irregularis]